MKVSIITATYNSAGTLGQAAESLFSQTYAPIEYLVVDGGPEDGTHALVQGFGERVDGYIREPDLGIYDALNKGIERCTGDIIGLLHADDLLASPGVIDKIVRTFRETSCDAVYGDLQYVLRTDPERVIRHWRSGEFSRRLIGRGWMPPHPALFLRRELFTRFGSYDLNYRIAADYDLILRMLKDNGIRPAYLPEVVVRMRTGGVSNRRLNGIVRKSREDLKIMRAHGFPFPLLSLINKNLSKISQFYRR